MFIWVASLLKIKIVALPTLSKQQTKLNIDTI